MPTIHPKARTTPAVRTGTALPSMRTGDAAPVTLPTMATLGATQSHTVDVPHAAAKISGTKRIPGRRTGISPCSRQVTQHHA